MFSSNSVDMMKNLLLELVRRIDFRFLRKLSGGLIIDNGYVMRALFKNIPNSWPIWANDQVNCEYLGYFQLNYQHTFCQCVPGPDFLIINHYF